MAKLKDKLEQIGLKAKHFALAATVAVSGLFSSQVAKAQNNQGVKHQNNTETLSKQRSAPAEVLEIESVASSSQQYFSPESLAEAIAESGVSDEQGKAFIAAYANHMDVQGNISVEDLINVFKEANFSKEQAYGFSNSLFGRENMFHKQEQRHQDNKPVQKKREVKTDKAQVRYWVDSEQNTVVVSGDIALNVANLLPAVYEENNGLLSCGPHSSYDEVSLLQMAEGGIRTLAAEEVVSQDMQKRMDVGEKLSSEETVFMQKHKEQMDVYGLTVNSKGRLQQRDPLHPQVSPAHMVNMQATR